MPNLVIENVDQGSFEIKDGEFEDDILTFAGAGTIGAEGEAVILARDSVSKKLVPYVKGGATNENGIPKVMLTYPVTATGAGDLGIRAMVRGVGAFERAIIHADLDNSNIDKDVIDQVRQFAKINIIKEQELSTLDNQ